MKDTRIRNSLATQYTKLLIYRQILLVFIYLLVGSIEKNYAQDLRNLDNTLKFADYLFKTRQYSLATEEYERAVYYDSTNNNALLRLLQSYRYTEKYDIEKERFNYFFKDSLFNLRTDFAKEYVKNLLLRKEFPDAYSYLEKNTNLEQGYKETYQLGSILLQKKWDNAFNFALKHPVTGDKKNADLHVIAFRSREIKYKKPFVAALFSTVIPGTGKMYTKNWKDGIISLLFVGVNAWQAYRGFNKYGNESAYGWVFAGIATSFYIGNIFGSAKSAKKYNEKIDDQIYHETWHLMVDDM